PTARSVARCGAVAIPWQRSFCPRIFVRPSCPPWALSLQQFAGVPELVPFDPFWVAIAVFVLTYVLVIADRINRSIIALLGAGVMVVSGVLTQDEAIRGIDFNTIALLTGLMVLA